MAKQYRYTVYYDYETEEWALEDTMESAIYDTDTEEFLSVEDNKESYEELENKLSKRLRGSPIRAKLYCDGCDEHTECYSYIVDGKLKIYCTKCAYKAL